MMSEKKFLYEKKKLFSVYANDKFAGLPRMESLVRIANIPLVETGVKTAGKVYYNLKVSYFIYKPFNGIFFSK